MKRVFRVAALAAGLAVALPAAAQFAKPDDAVKHRQSSMALLGIHFSRIGAMANGRAPFDPKAAVDNAEVVAFLSKMTFIGFVPGTDKGSKSKPEIWSEAEDFMADATKMQEGTVKLNAAAKSGNLAQIKAVFGDVARTCKSCHDSFKTP